MRHDDGPCLMDAAAVAELLQLASRLRAVHETLGAREIEALVRRHAPAALPPRRDRRPIEPQRTIVVGQRRVMVQSARAAFAIG